MQDKKKNTGKSAGTPGKAPSQIIAGLRKTPAIMNLGGKLASKRGKL